MSHAPAFADFVRDAEALIDDPQAIADRLAGLLAQDGWLAPEHQDAGDRQPTASTCCTCRRAAGCRSSRSCGAPASAPRSTTTCPGASSASTAASSSETRYELVERGGREYLHAVETIDAHPGHVEALIPPAENIHVVEAGGRGLTISIHVYGADIERLGSSVYRRFDDLDALPAAA